MLSKSPTQSVPKTQLKSIKYVHGEPTLQFTFKELDEFATEEGLHQAIVMKFSYGAPEIQELRSILPKQFAIKGLPTSLFARKSLLSIALAAGRPIAIDKATQVRSRPSTERVKVELDLLDKHLKRIKLQYLDEESIHDQEVGIREEEIAHDIQKYKGDARRILNEKRGLEEVIQRDDDKNPSTCTKNNVLAIIESLKPSDAMHNNSSPILVQKNPQAQANLNYDLLAEKTLDNEAQGVVEALGGAGGRVKKQGYASTLETIETSQSVVVEDNQIVAKNWFFDICNYYIECASRVSQRFENTNSRVVVDASLVDSRQQLGDVNAHESDENHGQHLVIGQGKHAIETEHEATQRVEKSNSEVSAQHGNKGWKFGGIEKSSSNVQNVSVSDKELIDALGGYDVERLVSLTPINTNKQLQVGGSSTFSPNQFANLQDEEIDEKDWLDQFFENAARDVYIYPMQQRNNKKKHVRENTWDGKVTEDVVPRHLSMRLAKQNHMTVSTYSTRSNNSKKR
ncbi:hypothetical protein H5410_015861 [Solanum commersonii]|uniref:Uncharacterized protein n=1 Tax=Solanum commersonii TaxID=4109 RepID=A0A9J5ZUN3_SOLCO|nr:hypothetical protein H5410_015861 [Solanum commersonii]